MREVISVNGTFIPATRPFTAVPSGAQASQRIPTDTLFYIVGQAGCQIANSCWEVSFDLICLRRTVLGCINAGTNKDFFITAVLPRTRYSGQQIFPYGFLFLI